MLENIAHRHLSNETLGNPHMKATNPEAFLSIQDREPGHQSIIYRIHFYLWQYSQLYQSICHYNNYADQRLTILL